MIAKNNERESFRSTDITRFSRFISDWMKQQGPGYRDFDHWHKTRYKFEDGQGKLTSRLNEISHKTRRLNILKSEPDVLNLFALADYSYVPVKRVADCPGLNWIRQFPNYQGIEVIVYTNDHRPQHIHARFVNGNKEVRLEWPTLIPLPREPSVSRHEQKKLEKYAEKFRTEIYRKVKRVAWS